LERRRRHCALASARPPSANMVNLKLRYYALESRCWGGRGFEPRSGRQISTARVQNCGIPATGSNDCRIGVVLALELGSPFGYLISGWGTQTNRLGPR
jgi:hypothetical protein